MIATQRNVSEMRRSVAIVLYQSGEVSMCCSDSIGSAAGSAAFDCVAAAGVGGALGAASGCSSVSRAIVVGEIERW